MHIHALATAILAAFTTAHASNKLQARDSPPLVFADPSDGKSITLPPTEREPIALTDGQGSPLIWVGELFGVGVPGQLWDLEHRSCLGLTTDESTHPRVISRLPIRECENEEIEERTVFGVTQVQFDNPPFSVSFSLAGQPVGRIDDNVGVIPGGTPIAWRFGSPR
ncbi:hypothetical protein FQN57_002361 [Myotisia sp. PD_48]|nr:hypothetical protein FQN57_002361 [Myotisia sp. PD_48]